MAYSPLRGYTNYRVYLLVYGIRKKPTRKQAPIVLPTRNADT